ncbi:MAG: SHOCT domain-containing protein [Planctomycetota bacterium]|nr:SHOCT domain-containing protein [Planctomycetota bacterium]
MSLKYFLILIPLLSACSSLPKSLTTRENPERAVKEVFSWRVNTIGARIEDRKVVEVTPNHIVYRDGDKRCRLSFEDVAVVDQEFRAKNSDRLETVRLFLVKDSASINSTVVINGPFSFGRPHIELKGRPQGTLARLRGSLDKLKIDRDAKKKAAAVAAEKTPKKTSKKAPDKEPVKEPVKQANPSATPAPTVKSVPKPTKSGELEEKLMSLKAWFDKGLITQDEYDQKRKALLEKY